MFHFQLHLAKSVPCISGVKDPMKVEMMDTSDEEWECSDFEDEADSDWLPDQE